MSSSVRILLMLVLAACASAGLSAAVVPGSRHSVSSPDGAYTFTFYQKASGGGAQMFYTLAYKGQAVIDESALGVQVENALSESALGIPNAPAGRWSDGFELTGTQPTATDETWMPVYGERSTVRNHFNGLTLSFRKGNHTAATGDDGYDKKLYYYMDIEVRAYNEGVAFRYHFPEATNGLFLHITGEQTEFALPAGTLAWYERWAQGPYELLPLGGWTDECERPLTLRLPGGLYVALAEAGMTDYARMKFSLSTGRANTLLASLYGAVDVITPYNTPWRVVMAAEEATELLANNDIILNLNPPNRIADTSWIKPGKVLRVFRLSQAEALRCVDFAAARGLQYIHLDAGWYGPEVRTASDATTVAADKDFDMPALTAYAAERGIGVWVYVNQRALVQQLDELLPLYSRWGIKGIKFGFVQVGSQYWSTWLHEAVRKCAAHRMMVDIHDEYRPTGFSRTWPNLLTQEGVRGNEEMPDATHNTILPFTRFLAGAADYTICYYNPRIRTTHAHQLALSVVYYSPLQFLYWYDSPEMYGGEPEIEFFDRVPTVWDDTRVLGGEPGQYVTIARRSGDEWFLGAIGNNEPRTVTASLAFLTPGQKYIAHIYTDDDRATTRTRVMVARRLVDSTTVLTFELKGSGGAAVRLVGEGG